MLEPSLTSADTPPAMPASSSAGPTPAVAAAAVLRGLALIVDDEPLLRALVCSTLKRAGLAVAACPGGAEALAWLAAAEMPPDVVVLDMSMPGLSGLETAARIRDSHPRLPVVLTSGYAPQDLDARVIAAFIQKPYKPSELVALVGRILDTSRR